MRKLLLATATVLALSCVPQKNTPIADIAKLTSLEDVMDNQATTFDPQYAKVGAASYSDADFAALGVTGDRIQATSLKVKEFAKGRAEFEGFATTLNEKAKALSAAAGSKNAAAANTALTEMKAACKGCHSKFK